MSRSVIDIDGCTTSRVVDWKPTWKAIGSVVGFATMAGLAAAFSPLLIVTGIVQYSYGTSAAVLFGIGFAVAVGGMRMFYLLGAKQMVFYKRGRTGEMVIFEHAATNRYFLLNKQRNELQAEMDEVKGLLREQGRWDVEGDCPIVY